MKIQYTFTFGFCGAKKNESYMKVFVKRGRGGVPPAFLYAVALAHPVVYFHFRILREKETCFNKVFSPPPKNTTSILTCRF